MMATKEECAERVELLKQYNIAYRAGNSLISDAEYDQLTEELRLWDPNHPFFDQVEEESIKGRKIVHSAPTLSTEKAYTKEALQKFVERMEKAAAENGFSTNTFRVTPKLDGMAGKDENNTLVSRGNGREGTDISHAFTIGVQPIGGRNQGVGELVAIQSYFEENCAHIFTHPRNMVVGCISSDTVNEESKKALEAGAIHFMPYIHLDAWEGSAAEILEQMETITQNLAKKVDYPLDGMVAEITNSKLKTILGATSHHNRWQIAIKTKGETAQTTINEIGWQTGKTGKITPVLRVEPTEVSGAIISNITAHNAGMVKTKKLGVGAKIEIIRSGEVIPKLERVISPAKEVIIPNNCPACGSAIIWENDFILCQNKKNCPAQQETALRHFFKTLGTADGFGPRSLEILVAKGHISIPDIFALKKEDFFEMDFGEKQSENLEEALQTAIDTPTEDARFLCAFGINDLGLGSCRRVLKYHPFETLADLSKEDFIAIDGFGEKTGVSISEQLQKRWSEIEQIYKLGFNLQATPLVKEQQVIESPISGKVVMFTGKMELGNRDDMQQKARELGATVLNSVSKKLEILIIGTKPSGSKLTKAKKYECEILSEEDYLALIKED